VETDPPPPEPFQFFPSCSREAQRRRSPQYQPHAPRFRFFPSCSRQRGAGQGLFTVDAFNPFPVAAAISAQQLLEAGKPFVLCIFQFFPSCSEVFGKLLAEAVRVRERLSILSQLQPTTPGSSKPGGSGATFNSFPVAAKRHGNRVCGEARWQSAAFNSFPVAARAGG